MTDLTRLANQRPLPDGAVWMPLLPVDLAMLDSDLSPVDIERVLINASSGPCGSLWVHGQPLCAVGIANRRGGLGEAWAVIDKHRRRQYPLLLTRAVRDVIDIGVQSLGLSELHLFVQFSQVNAMKWAKALGFKLQGELVFYEHPKRNHFIYSRSF